MGKNSNSSRFFTTTQRDNIIIDFLYILYSTNSSPARDYEVDRSRVELHEIIGEGQFGDVHKGLYHVPSHQISQSNLNNPDAAKGHLPIAVKTCKVEGRESMAEKFLEEACKFRTNDYIPQRKYLIKNNCFL